MTRRERAAFRIMLLGLPLDELCARWEHEYRPGGTERSAIVIAEMNRYLALPLPAVIHLSFVRCEAK